MRYMIINYYKKPTGQMDEVLNVSNRVKTRDLQSAAVILDFQKLAVVKASLQGQVIERDWDRIVSYYYKFYPAVMERLFQENGHALEVKGATNEEKNHTD